jgi:UDP-N-acetyl-2-amino-2-deoxyglucuronate dehydrogenase
MIEKPIDISLDAADRIIAAERASGAKVAVVSQHRFDRSTEEVVAAIQAGDLGRLTSGIASTAWWRGQSYYDSGRWRGTWAMDGGGAIMNQTIHTIDLLVAMMGVPTEVFAYAASLAHERIEVEDTAVAVVRFASGALGSSTGRRPPIPGWRPASGCSAPRDRRSSPTTIWSISTATPGRRRSCPCRHRRPTPTRSRTPTR